uniref:Peptidase S1 domain-containing protein n=1 Tax=Panagrolaimus davidi TaxID=227884 RepID=A0A914R8E1_9BILA
MAKFDTCLIFWLILYSFNLADAIYQSSVESENFDTENEIPAFKDLQIHKGEVANFEENKFAVGIEVNGFYEGVGGILSDCVIITAAHVVYGTTENIYISYGSPNLLGGIKLKIIDIKIYRKYKKDGKVFIFDVALMRTETKINFGHQNFTSEPILLPDKDVLFGTIFRASGWGSTSPSSGPSSVLLTSKFRSIDQYQCREKSKQSYNKSYLCTIPSQKADAHTCPGDSGAPLVKDKNGKKYIYGVLSHGSHQCDSPFGVDVFADIFLSEIMDWIKEYLQKSSSCPTFN